MNQDNKHSNSLINETSPYLLQHARNPVEWYPWGAEALEKARRENKPILLSVGYSACHWCHVMAHESFEDSETAELMNELFINIKVDREERPDIDKIYQTAHSLLTQRPGGWPLTVFLTPDDTVPFFAGTYFPSEPRHGMPSFRDLMQRVHGYLAEHETDIRKQNSTLVNALHSMQQGDPAESLSPLPLDTARQQLEQSFDEREGGFGSAPKFPHPTNIERLLRHWAGASTTAGTTDQRALHMAVFTLEKMARGGVFDQLGGGFCRYSVDDQWMIPHFEKMLYDNGALLALYAEAFAATGNVLFKRICEQTADWVMRDMQAPEGGYYSSLDADSEGEEGKYYVWTPDEVKNILHEDDYAIFARRYGLDRAANFEGHWNLHVYRTRAELAAEFSMDEAEIEQADQRARSQLLEQRERRVPPGRDDKVLTSWNGLMMRGRLLATCKDGRAHLNAYLDDYVYLIDGILELLQVRWRSQDLSFAIELTEVVLKHFQDPEGGFLLIQRPKPNHDDATPSGNGIAAKVLGRLGHLLGESRYLQAADNTLKAIWPGIQSMPQGHASLLLALEESLFPFQTVVIRGSNTTIADWQSLATQPYAPRRFTLTIPETVDKLPGQLGERTPTGEIVAYVCSGHSCSAPVTEIDNFNTLITDTETQA